MAAEVSSIVGITFMVIGGLLVSLGLFFCYTTKGEYYNQDEVQAMVTAEVLEEEKKKREEADEIEAEMAEAAAAYRAVEKNSAGQKKKRRRGPMVAA